MGCGSVGELHLNPRVQYIGSHPHSGDRCFRRLFTFTVLRTWVMFMLVFESRRPYDCNF
jgi:hypothetical protein